MISESSSLGFAGVEQIIREAGQVRDVQDEVVA